MNEDQIKALRHSFTNPHREDLPKPKVNKFGHTVLGDEMELSEREIDLKIDESGALSAEPKQSLFDSPEFQKWAENQPILKKPEPEEPILEEPIEENFSIAPQNEILAKLLNELDEMDGTAQKFKAHPNSDGTVQNGSNTKVGSRYDQIKDCANKECLYALPKDAKFCMKCGTAQMPKFCTECGYSFPGMEKFCPDCGNKR
jgi:RNA polymerase subunit RPABC4/transcription elongation factor Spt4